MAHWKVSREIIELKPHYNADSLELAKAGSRQYVVKKGIYNNGDVVISVPEKSILPEEIAEPFKNYLAVNNRVRSTKLRGELSEGVLLEDQPNLGSIGEDISEKLGITLYEPPIPASLAGVVKHQSLPYHSHDCEPFGVYSDEFSEDEEVLITEKLHGSLISVTFRDTEIEVTSKGLGKRQKVLEQSSGNIYWQALENSGLADLDSVGHLIQIIGEVVPCQKSFDYGHTKPTLYIYKLLIDGKIIPYDDLSDYLKSKWVPVLYRGKYDPKIVRKLAQGKTSLNAAHIKEGVVVTPVIPRKSKEGFDLALKFISDEYAKKATGEEFN